MGSKNKFFNLLCIGEEIEQEDGKILITQRSVGRMLNVRFTTLRKIILIRMLYLHFFVAYCNVWTFNTI